MYCEREQLTLAPISLDHFPARKCSVPHFFAKQIQEARDQKSLNSFSEIFMTMLTTEAEMIADVKKSTKEKGAHKIFQKTGYSEKPLLL